jgi:molybdopterin converting factor small subunit
MNIVVECHGASQRWCGASTVTLELADGAAVADALDLLARRFPEFARRRATVAIAIGDDVVKMTRALCAGERVALIPPVSGG